MELCKLCFNLIFCGDYNICYELIDIYDLVCNVINSGFLFEEWEWMICFLLVGFIDFFCMFYF